jgi:hypothetical protein
MITYPQFMVLKYDEKTMKHDDLWWTMMKQIWQVMTYEYIWHMMTYDGMWWDVMRCHLMIVHSKSLDSKSKILLLAQLEASEESSSEQSGASEAGKYAHGCSFIFFCAHTQRQTHTHTNRQTATHAHTHSHTVTHSHTPSPAASTHQGRSELGQKSSSWKGKILTSSSCRCPRRVCFRCWDQAKAWKLQVTSNQIDQWQFPFDSTWCNRWSRSSLPESSKSRLVSRQMRYGKRQWSGEHW